MKRIVRDLDKFYEGVFDAVDVIGSTYGYYGHNVLIEVGGQPLVTKDGAFVSNHLGVEDSERALAARMVKDGSLATYSAAGDGTTTCAVLIGAMVKAGLERKGDASVFDYLSELKTESEKVLERLDIMQIESEDDLCKVGTVSANNNPNLGNLVGTMAWQLGTNGTAQFEEGTGEETRVSIIDGYFFDGKPFDKDLNQRVEMGTTQVFLACDALDITEDLKRIWNAYYDAEKVKKGLLENLLIICPDATGNVIGNLRAAQDDLRRKGNPISIVLVKAPNVDEMNDLAYLLDASIWGLRYGKSIKQLNKKNAFGEVSRVRIDGMGTVLFTDKPDDIDEYIKYLNENEDNETRIAKLKSGVGLIRVGGSTSVERNNTRLQLDDAYKSCFAALKDGVVEGGGFALHKAGNGNPIFSTPLRHLLRGATHNPEQIVEYYDETQKIYDLKEGIFLDKGQRTILDPVRATKAAVRNAVSAASQILSIKYMIVENR